MNDEDVLRNYIRLNPSQYSSKEVHDALKKMLEICNQLYGQKKKRMDTITRIEMMGFSHDEAIKIDDHARSLMVSGVDYKTALNMVLVLLKS